MRYMHDPPDAVVLCGGAGLRLRSVTGHVPKSMAPVAGRPFLEVLLRQLGRHWFRRVILAIGYGMDVIHAQFGEDVFGMQLVYSTESSPLGTAGALRQAAPLVLSESVLIMNGDSYTDINICDVVEDHRASNAEVSIVVVPADGRNDCGMIRVNGIDRVVRFAEKPAVAERAYVNAGIYIVCSKLLYDIPSGIQVSIEHEVFPRWLEEQHEIRAIIVPGRCVDIGTPERYWNAQEVLRDAEAEQYR